MAIVVYTHILVSHQRAQHENYKQEESNPSFMLMLMGITAMSSSNS